MKRFVSFLVLFSTFAVGQSKTDAYAISVHVTRSRCVVEPYTKGMVDALKLNVLIDGKKI
jgi:hypothetical protein